MPEFNRESSDVALRFHRDADWYVISHVQDLWVFRVHANGERVVELFLRLAVYLDDLVDLEIGDQRGGSTWRANTRFLPAVREALGRIRWPLATFGGAEVTLTSDTEQITLTGWLELVIYSPDDRWQARLEAEHVFQRATVPPPRFDPSTVPVSPAPELAQALATVVERLRMEPAE